MLIVCPKCKTKFTFDDKRVGSEGIKFRCGKCYAIFRIIRKSSGPDAGPGAEAPPSSRAPLLSVLVANESVSFCKTVKDVLASEPFEVHSCHDGKVAYDSIVRLKPDVILLDVALPSMYGFEVCEAVRKEPLISSTKIILIASIYDKTKYKRAPVSLYGADDYIEKHHIPDSLAAMIYRLVSEQKQIDPALTPKSEPEEEAVSAPQEFSPGELKEQEASRMELQRDEESETLSSIPHIMPELTDAEVKARRFARIIVSDIALYNQAKVEEGVRNGDFYALLTNEINEGRALYLSRVPENITKGKSYLEEAFEELIAKTRQELGL
jgi:predicted Zn finger-like uncharacterized protein